MPYRTESVVYTPEQLGLGGSFLDTLVGGLDKLTMSWTKAKEVYGAYSGKTNLTPEQLAQLEAARAKLAKPPGVWDKYKLPIIIGGGVLVYLMFIRKK